MDAQTANAMQNAANTMYQAAEKIKQSVLALSEIEGMIALNKQREIEGKSMAYDEGAFFNSCDELRRT